MYMVFNPFSAGIDFSLQNLTSRDVRIWRLKSIPAPKKIGRRPINTYVIIAYRYLNDAQRALN